ncbi:glutathionylspermidine synthase family protein [Paenibacillus alkalitolerans]|uniref:glutathionylspermidine synthase family protein n=1 Tax=Paenibacillus alkalitolerans TaxID=2799335 RepID=UPI0018F63E3C|nr:glutathionylspermidine synthase family protein [Paenibacillus alkalitolerans]
MKRIVELGRQHDDIFRTFEEHIPYHRMYGKQYCLPSVTVYRSEEYEQLKRAAEQIDNIYWKVLRFAQRHLPDRFLEQQLGIHAELIPAARMEVPFHGVSRQDWIVNEQGIKCIENNTDTPTGIPETAYLANEMIKLYTSYAMPSSGMKAAVQSAFQRLIDYYGTQGLSGLVVFSCYDWHAEDKANTLYLMDAVKELGYSVKYAPLDQLEIIPVDGLYFEGEKISILYRLYPLEYQIHDTDNETGAPIGEELVNLLTENKLGLINPAQSAITQSKGFIALIWSLYERNHMTEQYCGYTLFNEEEMSAIANYFLPTYYIDSPFVETNTPYVAKGYWGREGKGISLFNGAGALVQSERGHNDAEVPEVREYYENQPKVFQQFCPMERLSVNTEEGAFTGYLLTGVYVIGGRYAGLLPRIGGKITGDMAYYCPAAVSKL